MGEHEHEGEQEMAPHKDAANGGGSGLSVMDRLRQHHSSMADGITTKLTIPGYKGELVAEYRVLDVTNELDKITVKNRQQYSKMGEVALYVTMDVLITACVQLYFFDGEKMRPLSESIGPDEPPVRYDDRLAEFLGLDTSQAEGSFARETLRQTFGGNEQAIIDHGRKLNQWMSDTSAETMEGFLATL
jgi:hypothetical protein